MEEEDDSDVLERRNNSAWMVIIGDAIRNLIDGLSLGAALPESYLTGFAIAIAILFEEIPFAYGMTRSRAAMFNLS